MIKKNYKKILKATLLILLAILLIIMTVLILTANENSPENPLDFQDLQIVKLEKPIKSVEDGLPFAVNRAHKWRKDAVLMDIRIMSEGKSEIENRVGKLNYRFEFTHINENKPGGILFVSINTKTNSIEYVHAEHDQGNKSRKVNDLKFNNIEERISKVYDIAINAIGKDNIFQPKRPFVRVSIDSNVAIFEAGSPGAKEDEIEHIKYKYKTMIDMKTYNIIEPKE